jgi:uroporphyrinogen-III decarboxylase
MKDAFYDYDKVVNAVYDYHMEFQPDVDSGRGYSQPGPAFDILGYKLYDWPGQKLADDLCYQMIEGEYVTADEYPELINDSTGFFIRAFIPRLFTALEPLKEIPMFQIGFDINSAARFLPTLGKPDVQQALQKLMQAGSEAMRWAEVMKSLGTKIRAAGFPAIRGGGNNAPFDFLGDTLRGTRGVLTDLFRQPDKVIEACERFVPLLLEMCVRSVNRTGVPIIFLPLHKGSDEFMSQEQFKTFYWPTLKAMTLGLVEEGIVPQFFAEGSYNKRLEIIADFPKGKCIWWFDQTDMKRAKEVLGDVCCISGNVPSSIMSVGTPDQVKAYCKELIEVAGNGGGFILTNGCNVDQARAENVRAMIEAGKEYGVYA